MGSRVFAEGFGFDSVSDGSVSNRSDQIQQERTRSEEEQGESEGGEPGLGLLQEDKQSGLDWASWVLGGRGRWDSRWACRLR